MAEHPEPTTDPTKPIVARETVAAAPRFPAAIDSQLFEFFDGSSTTPDVANIQYVVFQNTAPGFTVTNFLNGQDGQHLYVMGDGNVILDGVSEGTLFKINPTRSISQVLFTHLLFKDEVWREVSVDLAQLIPGTAAIVQNTTDEFFDLIANVPQLMNIPVDFSTNFPPRWTSPGDGQLEFSGVQDRLAIVFVTFAMTPLNNNRTFTLTVVIGGVPITSITLATDQLGISVLVSISGIVSLTDGNIIEATIEATSNTSAEINNFTIQAMDFFQGIIF